MLDRKTELLPKRLQDIYADIQSDFSVSELNIHQKSLSSSTLKSKWLMIYLEEKKLLNTLKDAKAKRLEEYVEKHGKEGVPKKKTEMEAKSVQNIAELNKAVDDQTYVVEFLQGFMEISKVFNFDLKNAVDIIKIEK